MHAQPACKKALRFKPGYPQRGQEPDRFMQIETFQNAFVTISVMFPYLKARGHVKGRSKINGNKVVVQNGTRVNEINVHGALERLHQRALTCQIVASGSRISRRLICPEFHALEFLCHALDDLRIRRRLLGTLGSVARNCQLENPPLATGIRKMTYGSLVHSLQRSWLQPRQVLLPSVNRVEQLWQLHLTLILGFLNVREGRSGSGSTSPG